jgi:carboxymethylenebutenolidase
MVDVSKPECPANDPHPRIEQPKRRRFVTHSTLLGLATWAGAAHARDVDVVQRDVSIHTPSGNCDAFLAQPLQGKHPGILLWTDVFGLRAAYRNFAQRLAAQGYCVLVPNPFYRVATAPLYTDVSKFNFGDAAARAKLMKPMQDLMADGIAEGDAKAYLDFLAAQPGVLSDHGMGVHGYCMGGPLAIRTGAIAPDRVAAIGSFHGGGLVTDQPGSPHRLATKLRAQLYIGIAQSDDQQQPDAKDALRQAFAEAKLDAKIEVYPAPHGWCVPDMPVKDGQPTYRQDQAERAWAELIGLYGRALMPKA